MYLDRIYLVAGGVPEAGDNLLQNGSFESSALEPWALLGNHTNSVISSEVAYDGAQSLHLIATSPGSASSARLDQLLPALSSTGAYTLSFWYLQSTNGTGLWYRLSNTFRNTAALEDCKIELRRIPRILKRLDQARLQRFRGLALP